jgi:putative ABC transport system substrate-binding protein
MNKAGWASIMVAAMLLAVAGIAKAQPQKKVARIGVLSPVTPPHPNIEAFRQGLRELGYIEGQNIIVEYRYAEGKPERLAPLADELVRLKVDVIVTNTTPAVRAVKGVTATIPIVIAAVGNAVEAGLVKSLSKPGENVTGLSFIDEEIATKRLELLKEVFPKLSRVAVLRHVTSAKEALDKSKLVAPSLNLQLQVFELENPGEFDSAFEAMKKSRAEALSVLSSAFFSFHGQRLVDLATKSKLPAIYEHRAFVERGGLMSYGPHLADLFRRAAIYVDKILNGTKPADLPVEQPTKFELLFDLKAAKQIGVTIPPNVLARADKVFK